MKSRQGGLAGRLRWGISQTEVLVVIAIMALLFALLLPAVESVRATSRRTACANQMRQLGLALHGFEETHGRYPSHGGEPPQFRSWILAILPWMDPAWGKAVDSMYIDALRRDAASGGTENQASLVKTALSERREVIPWLHCPADPSPRYNATSYFGNAGTSQRWHCDDGLFRFSDGSINDMYYGIDNCRGGFVTRDAVRDGLTHTAAIGEGLHEPPWRDGGVHVDLPARFFWKLPRGYDWETPFEQLVENCREVPPRDPERYGWQYNGCPGDEWMNGGLTGTVTYYHAMLPNRASCQFPGYSNVTSASYHRGGVNSLFADGHLYFVNDNVDERIWRAWGTRAGGEVFSEF